MSSIAIRIASAGFRVAALGTEWAGTFLRLCIPPPPGPQRGGAGARTPAGETWYAEPAKVADNLYFISTKIHSAWAITGREGMIVIEALFDYAASDEIFGGLSKLGLDRNKVRYVILSLMLTRTMTGVRGCCNRRFRAST